MASLKEIKTRIASVQNTLKITSAMKVVASAKLHRVQMVSSNFEQYSELLKAIAASLYRGSEVSVTSELTFTHENDNNAVVVAISSDSSLCGAFNHNVFRQLTHQMEQLQRVGYASIKVYTIGEKITQSAVKAGYDVCRDYISLASKPDYEATSEFAEFLMKLYLEEKADRVSIVYNHFKSMGKQIPQQKILLPFSLLELGVKADSKDEMAEYICEPELTELLSKMTPEIFKVFLHELILDSATAEHAARTVAMQTATDNADDLLDELSLTYNKTRQKAITDELSDITQTTN